MNTLLEYKCPACGGALAFDSGLQKMKCPYCDTEFEVEALQQLDEALRQEKPSDFTWESQPEACGRRMRPKTCAVMFANPAAVRSSVT